MLSFIKILFISLFIMSSSLLHSFTVGIIGVDEEELGDLLNHLELQQNDTVNYGMRKEYNGTLWGIDTVLYISNVGKAAAASATTDMILRHNVSCIFFLGTAGSVSADLNVGDVVIADCFVNYDTTAPFENWQTHERLSKVGLKATEKFLQAFDPSAKVMNGMIGTADRYMVSKELLAKLNRFAPEVLCIEMEGSACAQVADWYGIPFTAIRTISNSIKVADDSTKRGKAIIDEYSTFLEQVQRFYTFGMLERIYSSIEQVEIKNSYATKEFRKTGVVCMDNSLVNRFEALFPIDSVILHTKPGKASAASAATELIINHGIQELIVISTAKPLSDGLQQGEIVLSSSSFQCDVDVRPFRPLFQIPYLGITEFASDRGLIARILNGEHYTTGKVASSDSQHNEHVTSHQDVLCIDSTAAPCAQIAFQYGIPFASVHVID